MISPSRERLYAVSCAAMFVFGMILSLPGTVLGRPEVVEEFGLSFADRGVLISTLFLGLLFGSLLSGPLVDALGQRVALSVSAACAALCLPLFALAPSASLAAVALAATGLASAAANTASNALSSDLFPDERGRRMNGIAVMVGLGGLAMPVATVLASAVVSWRTAVVAGGVLSAVVAFVAARTRAPEGVFAAADEATPRSSLAAIRDFWGQPGFAWFCLLIMIGGGNEASMAGWTSSFLTASGFSGASATWALSSHWLGLTVSRALLSGRVDRAKAYAVDRSARLTAVLLAIFVLSTTPVALALGPFFIGVTMALVMPTSLALAGERFRGNAGTLFGALLTLAQVGGMLLPSSIGFIAERRGVRLGLALLILTNLAIAFLVRQVSSGRDGYLPAVKAE